jgi:acyl-coenzyme A synthetase/AMP-(fatty) acid ligase
MSKQVVTIGVANDKEKNVEVDELKNWTPKNVNYFRDTVYFKYDGIFYSMGRIDYDKIFSKN